MEEVKLGIIGSRTFKDQNRGFLEINEYRKIHNVVAIVSGVSIDDKYDNGADTIGRNYAREFKIKYIGFPAQWDDMSEPCVTKYNRYGKPYNALAGFKRNTDIVKNSTHILAFWDGKSKGTKDSIDKAIDLLGEEFVKIIYI